MSTDVPSISVPLLDQWLVDERPEVEAAAEQLRAVRRLQRQVRMAEAHLLEYLRQQLTEDEFSPDPPMLDEDADLSDD